MQDLVIDVNLSHFWLHSLSHFLLQAFVLVVCLLSDLWYSRWLYELREFEGSLVDTPFVLEVSSLLTPMPRNRHWVSYHFHIKQEKWVIRSHVPSLNHIWSSHLHLEIKHLHTSHKLLLFPGNLFILLRCLFLWLRLRCLGKCIFVVVCILLVFRVFLLLLCYWCREVFKYVFELCDMLYSVKLISLPFLVPLLSHPWPHTRSKLPHRPPTTIVSPWSGPS